ncbi:MAG: magnesium transporter CorA family protein [Anaerolineae bacterium]|nr:magnesium transporter CorA family protein [Anaerolineae bacterium]
MSYETLTHGRLTWTHITNPAPGDVARLHEAYPHFHPLDLEDCLSRIERPKIDEYDDYLFIVMHFPYWDSQERISRPGEVDFFLGVGYLVTVYESELKPLYNLFEQCQTDEETRAKYMDMGGGRLMHAAVDRMVDYLFPILYKVDANIRNIEENMFDENIQRTIQNISLVRRDIIALRRIIRPQVPIMETLEQIDRPFIREDLDVYFSDTLDHLQKARDIVEDDAEVINSLADTTDALASYRINEVMRILTVISVIMLPLTLISGILGMNVPLPLPLRPITFWGVMGLMVCISISMLLYFRYRRWL